MLNKSNFKKVASLNELINLNECLDLFDDDTCHTPKIIIDQKMNIPKIELKEDDLVNK